MLLKKYIPTEKQLVKKETKELPSALIWGTDPGKLRDEKERLEGVYQCICVTGSKAMEKYLSKHEADIVLHVI